MTPFVQCQAIFEYDRLFRSTGREVASYVRRMKRSHDPVDQAIERILAWALLLEAMDQCAGEEVTLQIHTLATIGRSISADILTVMNHLEGLKETSETEVAD